MSKPRADWWEYVKRIIRSYPDLDRKANSIAIPTIIPTYGSCGHVSTISNPTEKAVVDRLTDKEQRRYDAVCKALMETERMRDGKARIDVVKMVYWEKRYTIAGASIIIPCSEITAKRWNGDFVRLVAEILELV